MAAPIKTAKELGYVFDSKVLDIENVDLVMGKMMEQGPVLVISFTSQQILCVRDLKGNVKVISALTELMMVNKNVALFLQLFKLKLLGRTHPYLRH